MAELAAFVVLNRPSELSVTDHVENFVILFIKVVGRVFVLHHWQIFGNHLVKGHVLERIEHRIRSQKLAVDSVRFVTTPVIRHVLKIGQQPVNRITNN